MSASYIAWPFGFQLFDNNGNPAAGALVYSYVAGSNSILQNTYVAAAAGSAANTNPVVADADGRVNIYMNPNEIYRFIVTDATGAPTYLFADNVNVYATTNIVSSTSPNTVNALGYCTAEPNTGGIDQGGTSTVGDNVITLTQGPFVFNSSMVGNNIYVSGAFAGAYTTIASYISPTQVTTAINATATTTNGSVIVWNQGQDDTIGINTTLAAAAAGNSIAYFPTRVFVYGSEIVPPANCQGIIGDGQNATFFIAKNSSVTGNFLRVKQSPADFVLGGQGQGFTQHGPKVFTPIHNTSLTVAAGTWTGVVDNSQTAIVGAPYVIVGSRNTANLYNETIVNIVTSSSSGWTGTPVYWDGNTANGTVSSVSVASNVVTVLENNPYRRVGYTVFFQNLTSSTWLNGQTATVASIVLSGSNIIGYTYNITQANQSASSESGIVTSRADAATITDTFAMIPDWSGVRMSHVIPNSGAYINIHGTIDGCSFNNNPGYSGVIYSPNYMKIGVNCWNNSNWGLALMSSHPTTGFFSNPSAFGMDPGNMYEGNTLMALSIRSGAGATIMTPGCGTSGVLLYQCDSVALISPDIEVMIPWSVDTTMFPGYNIELNACTGCFIQPGYISFNSSTAQAAIYIGNGSIGCTYTGGKHFLAGSNVQPTYEIIISSGSNFNNILNPNLVGQSATRYQDLGQSNVVWIAGNYNFDSSSTGTLNIANGAASVAGTNHTSPTLQLNGRVWSGSADVVDSWTFQNVIGVGTNGTSTLTIGHTGTSGAANIAVTSANFGLAAGIITLTGTTLSQVNFVSSINSQEWNLGYNESTTAWGVFNTTLGGAKAISIADATNIVTIDKSLIITSGTLSVGSYFGVNGATPAAPTTGYGTPTGNAVQGSFAASSITLPNLAAQVAQLTLDLKRAGIIEG